MGKERKIKSIIPLYTISKIQTMCYYLQSVLPQLEDVPENKTEILHDYFIFAMVWAFGGNLVDDKNKLNRTEFGQLFREQFASHFKSQIDEGCSVFDYSIDLKKSGANED